MALIWRTLPDWPSCTDATGREWKLAPNGYWWLHYAGFWHQAGSQATGDVLGVPVPAFNPAANERQIRFAFGLSSTGDGAGGSSSFTTVVLPPKMLRVVPPAEPNIPPDFMPLPLGEGCCTECHLDDGPLYDGDLCRYCWMLAQVPAPAAAADVVELAPPLRQTLIALAAIVSLLLALWLGLRLALLIIGHL